jgi:vesicle transport through interaction with t-SNAREs protein 1
MDDLDRSDSPSTSSQSQAQRSRLLSATDKLSEGQQRLEDSHRIALETEELGTGILRDLRSQRDTLEHTRDTVRCHPLRLSLRSVLMRSLQLYDADGSIDRASNTLKKMIRTCVFFPFLSLLAHSDRTLPPRAQQQRLVTYTIVGVLLFLMFASFLLSSLLPTDPHLLAQSLCPLVQAVRLSSYLFVVANCCLACERG